MFSLYFKHTHLFSFFMCVFILPNKLKEISQIVFFLMEHEINYEYMSKNAKRSSAVRARWNLTFAWNSSILCNGTFSNYFYRFASRFKRCYYYFLLIFALKVGSIMVKKGITELLYFIFNIKICALATYYFVILK